MAASLIGAELGQEIDVSAVMVIYGPTVPWGGGHAPGRGRVQRQPDPQVLPAAEARRPAATAWATDEIDEIYDAAERALPPAD